MAQCSLECPARRIPRPGRSNLKIRTPHHA
nr:MAG TPA: hypothetical protein [Caudoviricetes sp.]